MLFLRWLYAVWELFLDLVIYTVVDLWDCFFGGRRPDDVPGADTSNARLAAALRVPCGYRLLLMDASRLHR